MGSIKCNGCTQCCRGPNRILELCNEPREQYSLYQTYEIEGRLFLANKPNGDCLYLTDEGCSIYPHRPIDCMVFDCRRMKWNLQLHPHMAMAARSHADD